MSLRKLLLLSILAYAVSMSVRSGAATGPPALNLRCVPADWQVSTAGHFAAQFDRRQVCRINYPWETGAAGDYGEISRTVSIPEDWQPPFWLRWYCSDNYAAEGVPRSAVSEGRTGLMLIGLDYPL